MLAMLCLLGSTREHNRREASKSQDGGPKKLNTEKGKKKKKKRKKKRKKLCVVPRRDAGVGEAGGREGRGRALGLHISPSATELHSLYREHI